MSFETGGDMQDPFEESSQEEDASDESSVETETSTNHSGIETPADEQSLGDSREENHQESQSESKQTNTATSIQPTEQDVETPYIKDIDVTQPMSTSQLACALMAPDYHEESPPVPYSVWRDGTSTGRSRTTIELNSDVDELVKQALREFNNRYDADIHKADVREFALTYGLAHLDEVFAMAEEWGIQFNS